MAISEEGLADEELGTERAELLPDREAMSLLSDPSAGLPTDVPTFLGPIETVDTPVTHQATTTAGGAPDLADGSTSESAAASTTDAPRDETYTSSDSASAG